MGLLNWLVGASDEDAAVDSFREGWDDARANVSTKESYDKGKNNEHYRKGSTEGKISNRHAREQDEKGQ